MRQTNNEARSCHGSGEATNQLTKEGQEKNFGFFTDNLETAMTRTRTKGKADDLILFTNSMKQIRELGREALNSILLDCG